MTAKTTPKTTLIDHPLVQHKLTIMRKSTTPSADFRRLLREISQLMTYEITRHLPVRMEAISTPLCAMQSPVLAGEDLVLVSILRAGNGLLDGILELVPFARVGFVGLYRDETTLRPVEYYCKLPTPTGGVVIAVDPMLATGNSAIAAIDLLKKRGFGEIHFLCLLASPEGISALHKAHADVHIVTASVDECLNEKGYIVPGLGDAGDRIFGTV